MTDTCLLRHRYETHTHTHIRLQQILNVTAGGTICNSNEMLFGGPNQEDSDGQVLWHVHTGFWCGDLRERNHLEDLGIDGMIILK